MPETGTMIAELEERAGTAELLIALPSCRTAPALEEALERLPAILPSDVTTGKIVVLHPDVAAASATAPAASHLGPSVDILAYPLLPIDRYGDQTQPAAVESLLAASQKVNARVCLVLSSELGPISNGDLSLLIKPVLEQDYDLTVPNYPERRFDGLINRGVVRPLTRALYGQRMHFPMSADFSFSANLAAKLSQTENQRLVPLNWITTAAICAGLKICEANVTFAPPAGGGVELSSVLAQVLASLFLEMDSNASSWQRLRGSHPVQVCGPQQTIEEPDDVDKRKLDLQKMDVQKMIDAFQRGVRDLFEIWSTVLPPATLLELKKLARMPAEEFRMPDTVWVRLLYDFALGHRQRVMTRDHLLRSFTPAYLAWVASYALEVQSATPQEVEQRLERLYSTFEASKPYLLSRWRWPDRFNP